ncbi:DEAD/DEAH box helicase [Methanobacterium movens]
MNEEEFKDKIVHIEVLPSKKAVYSKVDDLPANIINYLNKKSIRLYKHQVESLKHLRSGKNIIITTPTASGKTLAFNIPIFEKLHTDDESTALYIYPAKALENDQLKTLLELEEETRIKVSPHIYDGDTDKKLKPWIRENSRIILTNPHELHLILPWNYKWASFLKNLKFVVIDEAHLYRGVFGSNIAYLIRRLRRICAYYGSNPQFILSTATIANPLDFSTKLTGLSFELISEDGSPSGNKNFIFYNPYHNVLKEKSVHQETKNLFLYFVLSGLQTLCFASSRRMAELISRWAKKDVSNEYPQFVKKIAAYRAGYIAEERRKIESDLKNKNLRGVITTNALELGINIGSLDAVIISGYPGTAMSTWQQAGRSGRGLNDSIVVLVSFQNPMDQYLMDQPEAFFNKQHEHAIINLENPYILSNHILCAASEIPLTEKDFENYFGQDKIEILEKLKKEEYLKKTFDGWSYSKNDNITLKVNIKHVSSENFKVMVKNKILETLDQQQAYREAHEGAVLINKSDSYIVEKFDMINKLIKVKKWDVDYHTEAYKKVELKIIKSVHEKTIGDLVLSFGDLEVVEEYYKYSRFLYDKKMENNYLNLPSLKFKTKGIWFSLPNEHNGALNGLKNSIIAMTPFHIMCDQKDLHGMTTTFHEDTALPTLFLYDGFEGGMGLSEKAIELFPDIILKTYQRVKSCSCKTGCPACIYTSNYVKESDDPEKKFTILALEKMIEMMKNKKS